MTNVHIMIEGYDPPGRTFCDTNGAPYDNVHVGLQVRDEPNQLVPGDNAAQWTLDIDLVMTDDGGLDFRGPTVHGKRGDRFLYLTWGNVDDEDRFERFRRAKLMLNRIDPAVVRAANRDGHQIVARVGLSDDDGTPRCARVDPPDITWSVATS